MNVKRLDWKFISIMVLLTALFLIVAFFAGCGDQQSPVEQNLSNYAQAPGMQAGEGDAFVPDEILVKFKPGALASDVAAKHGAVIKDSIPRIGVKVLRVPAGLVPEMVQRFSQLPQVEYAEPNGIAYAVGTPNDPYFGNQWGMTKINAPGAWDTTTGSSAVRIAILDTGIDQDHEDLSSKVVANANFSGSATFDDLYGHGTHCAGIAAAVTNNGTGVAGVGYNCSLMNGKVLGDSGSGSYSGLANGITWAANSGAKVISMSLGGSSPSKTLQNAVDYAWNKGCVLAAAAGNNGNKKPFYPAYYTNCIAVAASDQNDLRASFSNYGSWVDVAAPGVDVFSTLPNHTHYLDTHYGVGLNYGYLSGTSMATPHAAGLAGLLWAKGYTSNSSVRNRIENTCDTVGTWVAHGRINAFKAVQ